jgi:hypothetical protein
MEGNEGVTMGNRIQISRLGERFSSNTQMRSRAHGHSGSGDAEPLRERLIAAMVEVLAEGGDPRLL